MPSIPDAHRDLEIVRMRAGGMSVGQIAYQLQGLYGDPITAQGVTNVIARAARDARAKMEEIVEEQWWLGIMRAEAILTKVTQTLEDAQGNLIPMSPGDRAQLLRVALNVNERLAKQLGIDKENKSDTFIGGGNAEAMERYLREYGIKSPTTLRGKPVETADA